MTSVLAKALTPINRIGQNFTSNSLAESKHSIKMERVNTQYIVSVGPCTAICCDWLSHNNEVAPSKLWEKSG